MKKKLVITLLIMIIIIQSIIPIIVYANEEIGSETDIETETETEAETETQTQKKSFFDPDITYEWKTSTNNGNGLLDYGMCIPSTANEYEKIPLILWLHGWIDNPTLNKIKNKSSGIPYAVLGGSGLEGFSAYILCPKYPREDTLTTGAKWYPNEIKQLLEEVFEKYNVDRDNVVIIGHSFGGQELPKIVNSLPGYFSKAVICSGYNPTLLSIPTQWYVGKKKYGEDAGKDGNGGAIKYFNDVVKKINLKSANYECNFTYELDCGHGTPINAYNQDKNSNNRSDLIEWLFDEWAGVPGSPGTPGSSITDYTFENIENEATGLDIYAGMFLEPTVEFISVILDSVMSVLTSIMEQDGIQYVMVTEETLKDLPDLGSAGASYTIPDMTSYESIKYKWGLLQYPYFTYSPEEIFAGNIELLDINFISGSNNDDGWNKIRSVISQWYQILRMVTIIGLLSVLIYTGIKIMISSNTKDKAKYKELIANWFIAVVLTFSIHYIMAFILIIIEEILGLLNGINGLISVNANINFKTNLMGLARFQMQQQHFTAKVGYLIIYTALVVYTFKFTFLYLKRVLNMAFLTLIAPIVALTFPIDKANEGKAQGLEMWLKEFLYNALLQPVHYILYYILVTSSLTLAARNPIYGIVALAFLSQAEKLLKKIFGFDKARAGTVGGVAGAFATGALTSSLMKYMKSPLGTAKGKSKVNLETTKNDKFDMEGIYDVNDDIDWYDYLHTESNLNQSTNSNAQNRNSLGINNAISTYRNEIPDEELEELTFDDGFGGMQSLLRQIYQCENKLEDQTLPSDKREKLEEKLSRLKTALQNRLEFNETGFEAGGIPIQYIDGDTRTNAELARDVMNYWRMAGREDKDKNMNGMNARRTMQKLKRRMAENQYIQKQGGPQSLWQQERKDMLDSNNNENSDVTTSTAGNKVKNAPEKTSTAKYKLKNAPVVKGLKNVGKQIAKPAWDFEKDGKYNVKRLGGKVIKGVAGATIGVAAATVQAGISITDGKYNPLEGVATVAAGVTGVSHIGKGNQKSKEIDTVKKYGEQWFNRDDVISNYNREFPGQGKEMRRRAVENYISRGITDFKEQKQAIKYANVLKKERGLDEKEADKLAIATLQYKKSLASNKNYSILFDEKKREKYLNIQADAYTGSASKDSVKRLHSDFIENVREFNKANE